MASTQNIEIGPAKLTYGSGGSAVDLGHTLEGVEVEYEPEYADLKVDYYGNTPVNKSLVGESLRVTCQLAEPTVANLNRAISASTAETAGSEVKKVGIGRKAGFLASAIANQLRVHPLNRADSDQAKDWVIYRAIVTESVTMGYSYEDQRVLEVTFEALIDETKPETKLLGHFGPDTVS